MSALIHCRYRESMIVQARPPSSIGMAVVVAVSVFSFLGKQATAWLNGGRLSSVATEVPPGEGEVVSVAQSLSPQQPMLVNLNRLCVFQASL